jgi:hypothetical protein
MVRALPHTIGMVIPAAIVFGARAGGALTCLPVLPLCVGMPVIDAVAGRPLMDFRAAGWRQ